MQSQFDGIQNYVAELRVLFKQHWEYMEGTSLTKLGDYNLQYAHAAAT